jgi:hypothetical protein
MTIDGSSEKDENPLEVRISTFGWIDAFLGLNMYPEWSTPEIFKFAFKI